VAWGAAHDNLRPELAGVDIGRDGGETAEEGPEREGGEGHRGEAEDVVGPREGEDGREAEQRDEQERGAVARIREGVVQGLEPEVRKGAHKMHRVHTWGTRAALGVGCVRAARLTVATPARPRARVLFRNSSRKQRRWRRRPSSM